MDKVNIDAWAGRETHVQGSISELLAAQIHATIGQGTCPAIGDPLPSLWHWCAFPPLAPNSSLGKDGHIHGNYLLPPVPLQRRMWAGGSLSFHRPIHVGEALEQRSRVHSVKEKIGRTGPMVLVTLQHEIHGVNGLAIEEQQDIVFLEIPDRFSPPEAKVFPVAPSEEVETPETLLFRYSAITFNAHRIHYDRAYAREVEHYPGLVVHGPLQASLLMRAATREKGRSPIFFDFRGVYPMFAGTPCKIAFQENDEGMSLWTGQGAHQCMQARAVWEGTV